MNLLATLLETSFAGYLFAFGNNGTVVAHALFANTIMGLIGVYGTLGILVLTFALPRLIAWKKEQDAWKKEQERSRLAAEAMNQRLEEEHRQFKAAKKKAKRQRKEKILAHFETLYEQKKQSIGNITCPQCQWQGEWGTGITFRHYYAEPLKNNGIKVTEEELFSGKLSGNNQFLCPVCNSMNWSKV